MKNWHDPTIYYPTKSDPPCGAVFLLNYVRNRFRAVFEGRVSQFGSMYPESVQEFLTNHYNARTLDSPKVRVLLHCYWLVHGQPFTTRYGMNNSLLLELGHKHKIDPHMYMHHYRPSQSDPSPETLPSLRKVLKFETDKLVFTACVCTEPQDESLRPVSFTCYQIEWPVLYLPHKQINAYPDLIHTCLSSYRFSVLTLQHSIGVVRGESGT